MECVFGDKRQRGAGPGGANRQEGVQDGGPNLKRRRRFFQASNGPPPSAAGEDAFEHFEERAHAEGREEGEVLETEPVAPLNALELRDVVISDLVQKGWALSAHCRQKRAGKSSAGAACAEGAGGGSTSRHRAAQEASFISIPTGQASGSLELLEQMSQFESNTRQRLVIFGLERLSEDVFAPNRHLWQDHSHELGVLLHLHPDRRARRRGPRPVLQNKTAADPLRGKQQDSEPKAPQPKHQRAGASSSPFFLAPGDFSPESVARVDRARLEQCAFYGQTFSNFHCGSFVEVLSGDFKFDEQLPRLALVSSVTDEAVGQHISAQRERLRARAFRIPLTVRLSQKSGWVYIRSRDKVKAEVELRGNALHLFVGLWLTLERLWHVQHSTRHPHQSLRKEAKQSLELTRLPAANISVHVIESRDQLSVIRREFFFVLKPLKHLWARYLCELSRFVSTFTKRNKVWVDFEKQALCLSVVIPSNDDGSW